MRGFGGKAGNSWALESANGGCGDGLKSEGGGYVFCFLKVGAEREGARQGTWSQRLLLSLSLFLPFSLFSHPSFFATLLFPSFFSLYPLLFPNFFFFIFFSVSPFLTSFLYLDAFPDSFLLHSSLFHSLALSLSLPLSLFSFLFHFFFLFIFLFFLFLFLLG